MVDLAPSPSPSKGCSDRDLAHIFLVLVLVVLAISAMFLLHILGSLRRLSSHGLLHNMVMGINTLSYPLVSYTIGRMMNSSYCYVDDFAIWAVFMILLLSSTDNLTACRLDDIDNWKSIYVKHFFEAFLVVYVIVITTPPEKDHPYLWPLLAILFVAILKWYVRIASMRMVSRSYLSKNMRVIANYMRREQNRDNDNDLPGSFDPVTMEGYKYMVAGEKYCIKSPRCKPCYNEHGLNVITVEKIWRCTGNLLRLERGLLLKDVCLSMALSKMLNRRFAGFEVSEAGLQKTHDFVFKGLLAGDKPCQRAFRVIEEELVFVHDIYYTRYCYFYQKGRYLALCLPIIMFGLCSWLTYKIVISGRLRSHELSKLTIIITVVLALLEAYQLYLYVASGWFKVALIRSYVGTPFLQRSGCFLEFVLGLLLRLKAFPSWKNRLGQYCIIGELGHKGRVHSCLHYATLRLVDNKAKKGCKKSVKLSDNVKKAVVESLLNSNGHLTNGITSLKKNGVDGQLSWACHPTGPDGPVTRTILIWHIATTLCKHHLDAQAKKEEKEDAERQDMITTATTLSQYCMHLLAFAPDLLPDHSSISESIIEDAREILKGCECKRKEYWCDELMRISTRNGDGDEARLWLKGARLARHLIDEQEMAHRWKILSEFWAEMMLYVSPSDNARAHLEALARGGEFITQLWALLTHAGVLKRVPTGP